jgi:hypothetical protein
VTRPFDLDRVNAILASGHYDVDTWDVDDLGDDMRDGDGELPARPAEPAR